MVSAETLKCREAYKTDLHLVNRIKSAIARERYQGMNRQKTEWAAGPTIALEIFTPARISLISTSRGAQALHSARFNRFAVPPGVDRREIPLFQDVGSSRQNSRGALQGTRLRFLGLMWLLALLVCALLVAGIFAWFDVPVARRVYGILGLTEALAKGFASTVLLTAEAAVALGLVISRMVRGHLSRFSEATALACLTSICAYAVNDNILKLIFGVPNPVAVLDGGRHAIDFLSGSSGSSFPSGHMVLAGAFAGVFMRLYQTSTLLFSALLFIAAVLLVLGDWHFVSDVIAGAFLGVSAGLLAGELWRAHSRMSGFFQS